MDNLEWEPLIDDESEIEVEPINKLADYVNKLNNAKADINNIYYRETIDALLGDKVDKVDGKGLSTNDYTNEDKEKLNNIEDDANKIVVDSKLSETSTNPVQNKVVTKALDSYANALKGTASGEFVSIKDISPIEHNLKVKLASDDITDFSAVTLSTIGKNLMPSIRNEIGSSYGVNWVKNSDNSITLNGTSTGSTITIVPETAGILFKKGTYTISGNPAPTGNIRLWVRGVGSGSVYVGTYNNTPAKLTLLEDTYMYFYISISSGTVVDNLTIYPQFEIGNGTEYEPYIEPTMYTPNADGIVDNVKSIYPNTTLITDTSGILIECVYNKDTNKVIENLINAIISLGGNI